MKCPRSAAAGSYVARSGPAGSPARPIEVAVRRADGNDMDRTNVRHDDHRPGAVDECPQCARAAYEPGWYAVLLSVDDLGHHTLMLETELDRERGDCPVT